MDPHDQALSRAFDGQAPQFERSPVAGDAAALSGLVAFAGLPAGAHVLDAGCGPGLVAEAFLAAGCRVTGVDLSAQMIARARARCARFGPAASFVQVRVDDLPPGAPFDAAVSRFVFHHVTEPRAFLAAQVARLRPGGVVVASDPISDPDPARAAWHARVEQDRDLTHVRNLTAGELVDLFAGAGLAGIRLLEEPLELDFDEWFDRGTPRASKEEVRRTLLAGTARGFAPVARPDGRITIRMVRALVRGERPA
jgi:2-polyprenyl-3-methyl-5-hydroxy-6-metoxy-1,4-benzoquinol methylase